MTKVVFGPLNPPHSRSMWSSFHSTIFIENNHISHDVFVPQFL